MDRTLPLPYQVSHLYFPTIPRLTCCLFCQPELFLNPMSCDVMTAPTFSATRPVSHVRDGQNFAATILARYKRAFIWYVQVIISNSEVVNLIHSFSYLLVPIFDISTYPDHPWVYWSSWSILDWWSHWPHIQPKCAEPLGVEFGPKPEFYSSNFSAASICWIGMVQFNPSWRLANVQCINMSSQLQ